MRIGNFSNNIKISNIYFCGKTKTKVNEKILDGNIDMFRVGRPNELYTGEKLINHPNGVELAQKAGIKSVLSLEPDFIKDYSTCVKDIGMNFVSINNIGNKTLNGYSLFPRYNNKTILTDLINEPEKWITEGPKAINKETNKEISDIQKFIDILNGKDENFPFPIYYGCYQGINRTYAWSVLYNILKDEDRTQPLSEETIDKLKELKKDLDQD